MSFKTVVAVFRDTDDQLRVLDAIAPLLRENQSFLIGVHAEPSPAAYMPAIGSEGVAYETSVIAANEGRMKEMHATFDAKCKSEGINGEWRGFESFMGDSAVSALSSSLAADLIVVQQADPDQPEDTASDLEALLFETGRPVLVIPYTSKGEMKLAPVVIAWKDARESTRAVFDALPLIKAAGKVEILVIDAKDDEETSAPMTGAEIAQALTRHGVAVDVRNEISAGIPVAAVIENRLSDSGAGLLVMGAYSRSRMAERIFGGVTRSLLKSMPIPTFMSR